MKVRQLRNRRKVFADLAMYKICKVQQVYIGILMCNPLNGIARTNYKYYHKVLLNISKDCTPQGKRFVKAFLRFYG